MTVKTLKEAEDRIRTAMKPPQGNNGAGFSTDIQNIRKIASKRRPQKTGGHLPIA